LAYADKPIISFDAQGFQRKRNPNMRLSYFNIDKIIEDALDLEDGETGTFDCVLLLLKDSGLDDELIGDIADAAAKKWERDSALACGIPLDVIEGRSKLNPRYYNTFKGRPVEFELSYESDVVDTFIESAWYADGECEEISDEHYEELQELFSDKIYEMHQEYLIGKAEDLADRMIDR
jgi:hypothetical protein